MSLTGRRLLHGVAAAVTACLPLWAQDAPPRAEGQPTLRAGQVLPAVHSTAQADQSYALYLPSGYSAARPWPLVLVFDPGAVGTRPLQLMKAAAERHGYLVAGSNSSRNGSWKSSFDAANEMWADLHRRLAIDDRRVYLAGFSGGARVSAAVANSCHCARGVLLDGAGYSVGTSPAAGETFAVFSIAGTGDFNYGELLKVDADLDRLGRRHFLRRFDGEHAWAPAPVWDDALGWTSLLEMKDGLRPRDEALLASLVASALERGRGRESAGQLLYAVEEYQATIAAFDALADTRPLKERVAALGGDPRIAAARKQEKADLEKEAGQDGRLFGIMGAMREPEADLVALRGEAASRVRALRGELDRETQPERRASLQRVLGGVFVGALEQGAPLVEGGQLQVAIAYFELAALAKPDAAWPHLSLARCRGVAGDSKAALRELSRAVEKGLTAQRLSEFVSGNPKLLPLAGTESYRKLLASAPADEP
ncbi:MAG TPA: hypothetical protein VEQ10_16665 [Vicinamibacteria bacterium]|nr:hypothetical protein [Vicinamibacteria bacterium]